MKKIFFVILFSTAISLGTTAQTKNIVIVHGAFADGSGFKEVYKILTKKGFNVTLFKIL